MLTLAEQLLLLSLHDEKGSVFASASRALPYGLAGATILDLYFQERITFEDTHIHVVDQTPVGNALLDEVLALLDNTTTIHNVKYWIKHMQRKIKGITDRIAEGLVAKHILAKEEYEFLWVINYQRYPTRDGRPAEELCHTLRAIIVDDQPPTEAEMSLLSLMKACGVLYEIISRDERKMTKQKVTMIIEGEGEVVGTAVSAIVREVNAAIAAAIMASTTAAVTSSQ
ncbi:MAG: GPP34 family phosphoprotein [Chloroflexota bacterium]